MSHVVVVEKNKDGKIELTKDELQKMLDDAYSKGYSDGRARWDTIAYPNYPIWYASSLSNPRPRNMAGRSALNIDCSQLL